MDDRVVIEGSEDEAAGLPTILADLVRGNLQARPGRARVLDRMRGAVTVTAGSGEEAVGATLVFGDGRMRVRPGADPSVPVGVTGTFEGILGLSRIPMAGALPHPFKAATWAFAGAMRRGEVRIRGLPRAPGRLLGLLRLVSVD